MPDLTEIPVFTLFGETDHFPDVVHYEDLSARAPKHGWTIAPHRHTQMAQLFLIRTGSAEAVVDSSSRFLEGNTFLFVPAQSVHSFVFEPETKGSVVSFPNTTVSSIGPSHGGLVSALSKPIFNTQSPKIRALGNMIDQSQRNAGRFQRQISVGLSHALLGHIAEFSSKPSAPKQSKARRQLDALNTLAKQHLADGWTVADYSSALSMSTGHLSRICKKELGLSASQYIDHLVMEEACRLLAFTDIPVSEIGYRLGFSDPSYFSKRFRTLRHETPTRYRNAFLS